MQSSIHHSKAQLRAQIRGVLRRITPSARAGASEKIRLILSAWPCWLRAETVLFYAPLPDEPDLWPLFEQGLQLGKRCALPAYKPDSDTYEPRLVRNPATELRQGKLGVAEPGPACPVLDPHSVELVFVPGLAFDRRGYRLGRGKGYFDRLLPTLSGIKCGVAFAEQLVDALPIELHDARLDCIVTPQGIWRPARP